MITVYVFSVVTAFLVEAEIRNIFWRRSMQKRIRELKDHYIVCGLGDTGRYAVEELQKTHTPYVVIEGHEDSVKRFQEHAGDAFKNLLYVIGDATDEAVLDEAGIASVVFDAEMSVMDGSLGILPRRLMVADSVANQAQALIREAMESPPPVTAEE